MEIIANLSRVLRVMSQGTRFRSRFHDSPHRGEPRWRAGLWLCGLLSFGGVIVAGCGSQEPPRSTTKAPVASGSPVVSSASPKVLEPAQTPVKTAEAKPESVPSKESAATTTAAATATATPTATGHGDALFARHCAGCHGENGNGEGSVARFLYPKPRNLRLGKFKLITTTNSVPADDDLLRSISNGIPGSSMVAYGHLPLEERKALVEQVRALVRAGLEERLKKDAIEFGEEPDPTKIAADVKEKTKPGPVIEIPKDWPKDTAESVARGRALYAKVACASCHGETGKGDGIQEQKDETGMPIRPRDFTRGIFKGGRETAQLYARLALGVPGTPMPSTQYLKPLEIADLVSFTESLSDPSLSEKYQTARRRIVARKVDQAFADEVPDSAWTTATVAKVGVTPLWWRDFDAPELTVQAVHDGKDLAVRLTWLDPTRNDAAQWTDEFEDMAALQLFVGPLEPFLGMGANGAVVDMWHWRAGWEKTLSEENSLLDDYPFESAFYRDWAKSKGVKFPDFNTARAAGNLQAQPSQTHGVTGLTARGPGSSTYSPKASKLTKAKAKWSDGRWTLVLRRPLDPGPDAGVALAVGRGCSIAFALWDGAARDRNGQKLFSAWNDLVIE